MQTILGSGGAIGVELAKVLPNYTKELRLVSRNPFKINETDELFKADLTSESDVEEAVRGSEIVYLVAGLPYNINVWEKHWPLVMQNVINACKKQQAKLVFFDNIYMYDPNHLSPMDENTPINPVSKKGVVRAKIAKMLMDEVEKGILKALIARCADFYGPKIERNGMLREMVFNNFAEGKKANWLSSVKYKHSITYTPDAGIATAMLGNTEDAYNQVWHLPTASNPPTGKEWIEMIASEMGVEPRYQVASKLIMRIMGLFTPILKELPEMMYQYDRDYVFDSSKFEKRFNFKPTPYVKGIRKIIESDFGKSEA
jgi:nucleoside-diphosphate-sugar epimerase